MKLRIISKQLRGYSPSYYFQRKVFGIFWVTIVWGVDKDNILNYAINFERNLKNHRDDETIWVNR